MGPGSRHAGLGTESSFSGLMGRLSPYTLEQVGNPVVKGGSYQLVEAFEKIIEAHGGELRRNTDVTRIITKNGRAVGVETADGSRYLASRAVICNVTPTTAAAIRNGGGKGRLTPVVARSVASTTGSVVRHVRSGGSMRSRKSAMRGAESTRCNRFISVPTQDQTSSPRIKVTRAVLSSTRLARSGTAGGTVER